jgi:hypothetical protein
VCNHRVTFHFPESDTAEPFAAFNGLLGEGMDRASGTDLEFIVNHVSETLVKDTSEVDVSVEFGAKDPRVHGLVAVIVEAGFDELFAKVVCG